MGGGASSLAQHACKAAADKWAPDMLARIALLRVLQAYAPAARLFLVRCMAHSACMSTCWRSRGCK